MEQVKKQLLQLCANHGCLSFDRYQQILQELCNHYEVESPPSTVDEQKKIIDMLNNEIKKYNLTLTILKYTLLNQEYVVFGVTVANKVSKLQPNYTELERKLFHDILNALIKNQKDYSMNWNDIYGINNQEQSQHISKQRVQELQEMWVGQGYLLEQDDKIYLGPRALVEFNHYFRTNFAELVTNCPLCRSLTFWDIKCAKCNVKIHRDCLRIYLRRMSVCPECKTKWNTSLN